MTKLVSILAFSFSLAACSPFGYGQSSAATPGLVFEKISNEEGLPQNSISSIAQDATGFIWFGTPNGLIKHDGTTFRSYVPHPGDSTTLLNNLILKVFEDSRERLWVGTYDGLCRYLPSKDEFVWLYAFNEGIERPVLFNEILEDRAGRLWFATSRGLFYLRETDEQARPFRVTKVSLTKTGRQIFPERANFTALRELPDGSLLAGTNQGLFHLADDGEGRVTLLQALETAEGQNLTINALFQDRDDTIWLGCPDGPRFLNIRAEGGGYRYDWNARPPGYPVGSALDRAYLTCFLADRAGNLLIGTYRQGLFRYLVDEGRIEHYAPQPQHPHGISSNRVNDLLLDRSGVIWVATAHGGVNKIDTNRKAFFELRGRDRAGDLSGNLVNGLLIDRGGRLWVGTFQRGLNVSRAPFSVSTIYRTEFDHLLPDGHVNCFQETPEGLILIGTSEGLRIYDPERAAVVRLADDHPLRNLSGVRVIYTLLLIDRELWIGSHQGLSKITLARDSRDLLTGDFTYSGLVPEGSAEHPTPIRQVNVLLHDPAAGLWVGTREGLFLLRGDHPAFDYQVFRHDPGNPRSLSNNNVFSLHQDSREGHVWVGTFGGGLNQVLLDGEGRVAGFERLTKRDGLPDNAVYSILEDGDGYLWLSTDLGIARLNTATGATRNYNMEDGLPANNFRKGSALKLADGTMILGGLNGLTVFDPSSITENPYPPTPVITGLKLLNETVYPNRSFHGETVLTQPIYKTDEITLPHYLNQITLEFAAMHYAAPRKNYFQYRLDGVDQDWITVNNERRFAGYSQLRPGSYLFHLKSFNGDGLESENVRTLRLTIELPFYLTAPAFLLYFLLLAGVAFFVSRYAQDMIRLRKRILEEEREKERIREINEAKLQFFTDVSHEFRTPLTLIISPLEKLLQSEQLDGDLRRRITNINKNGQRLLGLTNTLIDFRKVEQGKTKLAVTEDDLGRFVKDTVLAFQDYTLDKNIDLRVQLPDTPLRGWFDAQVLERVLFNLLSNAIKHSREHDRVEVRLAAPTPTTALIHIVDTGKGMTPEEVAQIFERFFHGSNSVKSLFGSSGLGLALVKRLVDLHRGTIEVESVLDRGTTFQVSFPLAKTAYPAAATATPPVPTVEAAAEPTQRPAPASTEPATGDGLEDTLLVIEDNVEIRELIRDIFATSFTVLQAADGEEGFALALAHTPEIIISDVMMPKMNGFELSAKLKGDIRTSHIPLVLLTALNDYESKKTGFEEGGDVYISKPFSPDLLALQIKNLLRTRRREASFRKKEMLMEPVNLPLETREEVFLQSVVDLIEEHYQSEDLSVEMLTQQLHMSYIQFYRKFKAITGINAKEYIRAFRLKKAAYVLRNAPNRSISEVMYSVGFSNQSHFTNAFKKEYGMTPSVYKKQERDPAEE